MRYRHVRHYREDRPWLVRLLGRASWELQDTAWFVFRWTLVLWMVRRFVVPNGISIWLR